MVGRRRRWKALFVSASVVAGVLVPMHSGAAAELLSDGFESGTLGQWTSTNNFSAQQAITAMGAWAGRATGSTGSAHATKVLSVAQPDLYVRSLVEVVSHAGSTPLLRVRTAAGKILASLNVNASDKLVLKNVLTGGTRTSALVVTPGAFVDLQLHVLVNGASGLGEAWANGVRVDDISGTQDFGTAAVGQAVLGRNDTASTAMDVVFDDVVISTTFVGGGGGGTPPPTPTGLIATATSAHRVDLTWNASSGATGYAIYRDGGLLAGPTSTSFADTTVAPSTTYAYTVSASNGYGSSDASAAVGVTTPADSGGGDGAVVMAAGDIACDPGDGSFNGGNGTATACRQKWTAQLLGGADQVLAVGDTQYDCGGLSAFQQAYNPTWGQYKGITHPILSDEDYDTAGTGCGSAGPDGYFAYWGAQGGPQPGGYYSWDYAGWHFIALNSECSDVPGGCGEGSPQNDWLEQDLAAHPTGCTIAMLHKPRFRSKASGSQVTAAMKPFWDDLVPAGVEAILGGDSHFYERFKPQDAAGNYAPNGMVQWVVGVGGRNLHKLASPSSRSANSVIATDQTFGVLRLTLHAGSYDWRFLPEGSSTFTDTGSVTCH
jgi:acid phosphatase type 7